MTAPTATPVLDSSDGPPPTPNPGRSTATIWLAIGGTLALFMVAYGSLVLVNLLAMESYDEPLALDHLGDLGDVERLRIDANAGSVRVSAREGDSTTTVVGQLRVKHDLFDPEHSARIEGDTLVLETDCPIFGTLFCGVDYDLAVPADMVVEIDSSGGQVDVIGAGGAVELHSSGGGITVRDAAGPVTVDSSGGGVEVIDSGGDLSARSSGGSVRVSGSTADRAELDSSGGSVDVTFTAAPTDVEVGSSGGGVTVRLPDDEIAYDVDASSSGGDTNIGVRTDPTAERRIVAHSSGGGVDVIYAEDSTG